jgi:hypothetical protein
MDSLVDTLPPKPPSDYAGVVLVMMIVFVALNVIARVGFAR